MMWSHRITRAYWLRVRLKRYPAYARNLGDSPEIGEQLRLGIKLVWPLARSVFLMHCVDELAYGEIAARLRVDVRTVEVALGDALFSLCKICDLVDQAAVSNAIIGSPARL